MKKLLSLIVCSILCLSFFTGCTPKGYTLSQDKENISSIQIVSLKYVYGEDENEVPEEILICDIENISEFLEDFSKMEVERINPPYDLSAITNATAIKIVYNNGEYERIFPCGTETETNFYGSIEIDKNQFSDLIKKYVKKSRIKAEYNFLDRESSINSVQIIKVGNYTNEMHIPEKQTVIVEIDDISAFFLKFSEVDCFFRSGTPSKVDSNNYVIKITYEGGHYELIDVYGQSKSYYDDYPYDGFRYFDEEQFANLIEEYVNN